MKSSDISLIVSVNPNNENETLALYFSKSFDTILACFEMLESRIEIENLKSLNFDQDDDTVNAVYNHLLDELKPDE